MELIDVTSPGDRYVISSLGDCNLNYWVQPEITTSYFQECITSGSERKSICAVIKRQVSSEEEREGFRWS